jgi:hypothetical protein
LFWHCGLPGAIIAYAVLKKAKGATRIFLGSTRTAVAASAAVAIAMVCGLTWVAVVGDKVLPPLFLDAVHISPFGQHISGVVA